MRVEEGCVQQLKCTEEAWRIEWIGCKENKIKENIKHKWGEKRDSDASRGEQCRRTMMRLVSHR
jgi:hypothetical protein